MLSKPVKNAGSQSNHIKSRITRNDNVCFRDQSSLMFYYRLLWYRKIKAIWNNVGYFNAIFFISLAFKFIFNISGFVLFFTEIDQNCRFLLQETYFWSHKSDLRRNVRQKNEHQISVNIIIIYFLRLEKSRISLKLIETFSNLGKGTSQRPFFGELDIYGMKNRLIRYLWILKLMIKYMSFPRFRELIIDFVHFY